MKWIIRFLLRNIPRPFLIQLSLLVNKIFSIFLYGNKVECPVCNGRFRKFLPYGYKITRSNALCPKCLSLERHRVLWLFLKNNTNFFADKLKVLHIAPEQCFYKRFRKLSNLEYTTADIESPLADIKLDVQKINLPDKSYDVVICNHVLEHVNDDKKAISEIYRILKKGGFAILQVPMNSKLERTFEDSTITSKVEREKYFGQYDHVRQYGLDYLNRLKEAGFKLDEKNYLEEIDKNLIKKYGLIIDEIIPFVKK